MPLFLIARYGVGGLGLSEAQVGRLLAAGSVVSATLQRLVLDRPFIVNVYGALHRLSGAHILPLGGAPLQALALDRRVLGVDGAS